MNYFLNYVTTRRGLLAGSASALASIGRGKAIPTSNQSAGSRNEPAFTHS